MPRPRQVSKKEAARTVIKTIPTQSIKKIQSQDIKKGSKKEKSITGKSNC
jgi:hypothetical protein